LRPTTVGTNDVHYCEARRVGHYDRLNRALGHRLPVVWDRRRAPRRVAAGNAEGAWPAERRSSLPTSWETLGFVITHSPEP